MVVIGGILLFLAGVMVGGGVMAYHRAAMDRATAPLRRENRSLQEDMWQNRLETETEKAWHEGFDRGRKHPVHAVEDFADLLDRHNASVKVRKEA